MVPSCRMFSVRSSLSSSNPSSPRGQRHMGWRRSQCQVPACWQVPLPRAGGGVLTGSGTSRLTPLFPQDVIHLAASGRTCPLSSPGKLRNVCPSRRFQPGPPKSSSNTWLGRNTWRRSQEGLVPQWFVLGLGWEGSAWGYFKDRARPSQLPSSPGGECPIPVGKPSCTIESRAASKPCLPQTEFWEGPLALREAPFWLPSPVQVSLDNFSGRCVDTARGLSGVTGLQECASRKRRAETVVLWEKRCPRGRPEYPGKARRSHPPPPATSPVPRVSHTTGLDQKKKKSERR